MTVRRKILLALSDEEIQDFLPEPLYGEVLSTFPNHYHSHTDSIGKAEFNRTVGEYRPEIILSAWKTPALDESRLEEFTAYLKYYCHLTGTVRHKVPRSFIEKGLLVSNWGDTISCTVAECALLLVLSCLRRSHGWALRMHIEGSWRPERLEENNSLFGKRVGLHGFGNIARALVELLKPFNVTLKVYSPHVPDSVLEKSNVKRAESLEELFRWSQVLVDMGAYTPETYHLIEERHLRMLAEGACFVNVGRGAVVDEEALIRVAREGKLQFGLDVYETEPLPPDSPLRGLRNVNLLPHIAGPTHERKADCGRLAVENLKRYIRGERPEHVVDLEVYDRIT
jgi:phosphoglycerate dehydrogenase-like enzyme